MARTKGRRKRYLVNKPLQLEFSCLLALQAVLPLILLGGALYIVNKMYLSTMQEIIGTAVLPNDYIQGILNFSVLAIGASIVIVGLLLLFMGIIFSHHIAGPLYRLQESMDKLSRGEIVGPLTFRRTDIADDLATKFNAIAERLNQLKK